VNPVPAALIDAAVWAVWGTTVGYLAHRVPADRFARDGFVTRLRSVERDGRAYERIGIRRWKDSLPEAGAVFRGGVSKRTLPGRDRDALAAYAAETRRAELVHWLVPAIVPLLLLWNPWWLWTCMVVYAIAANVPCLLVQRYNRGRVLRALRRAGRRIPQHQEAAS
jgi:glycosyl-4,4'-diaponeurosporenoate acyltransferase